MTPTFESALLSFFPGVNRRAVLVTHVPGILPERALGAVGSGIKVPLAEVNFKIKANFPTACVSIWKHFFKNLVWISRSFLF
jgi:hypothetical protein